MAKYIISFPFVRSDSRIIEANGNDGIQRFIDSELADIRRNIHYEKVGDEKC